MITNHDVTYTVPPGKPLKVWEGKAASQKLDDSVKGAKCWLEGGAVQIVKEAGGRFRFIASRVVRYHFHWQNAEVTSYLDRTLDFHGAYALWLG